METDALKPQIWDFQEYGEQEAKQKKKKTKVDDEDNKIDCGVPSWMRKK